MVRRYPALFLLFFIIAGIVTADTFQLSSTLSFGLSLLCSLLGFFLYKRKFTKISILLFGSGLLFFSAVNFSLRTYDYGPNHIAAVIKQKTSCQIFGEVADWPKLKTNRTEIPIQVDSVSAGRMIPLYGNILLKVSDTTTFLQRGDKVAFYGTIYPLKDTKTASRFNYTRYLHFKELFGIVYLPTLLTVQIDKADRFNFFGLVDKIRQEIRKSFYRNLSSVSAALASGFLIGETHNIDNEVYKLFRDSGTLHLLAVSGSNVALVVLFVVMILRPFSINRYRRGIILIITLMLFTFISYNEPSVIRAAIMSSIIISAGLFERRYDLNNVISLTALTILLVEPTHLFNVGFQLSFVTAWGLILIIPVIQEFEKRLKPERISKTVLLLVIISLTAQLFSTPLIAYYFNRFSLAALPANILIVPMVSVALFGTLILLIADFILPFLGMLLGSFLNVWLEWIVDLLNFFGGYNSAIIKTGETPLIYVLGVYLLLVGLIFAIRFFRFRKIFIVGSTILISAFLIFSLVSYLTADFQPKVTIFKIPGGEAVLLKTEPQKNSLIITDLYGTEYPIDERIFMPFFSTEKIDKIENLIILSAQYDAIDDMLRLASDTKTEKLYVSEKIRSSFMDVMKMSAEKKEYPEIIFVKAGDSIAFSSWNYIFEDGLLLHNNDISFTIIDDIKTLIPATKRPLNKKILILSQKIKNDNQLRVDPIFSEFDIIVCSKNEQTALSSNTISQEQNNSLRIFDLNSEGLVEIMLSL